MKLLGTVIVMMMLSPACAVEDGDEAADETSESGAAEGFRSDVTICVDRETNECRLEYGDDCLPAEDDACVDPQWSPRACYAPGAICYGVWLGDDCPAPFEDACNFF